MKQQHCSALYKWLVEKLLVNFSLISPKSRLNLVSLPRASWHRGIVFSASTVPGCRGCSGRFVRREWKWSDTPHRSSIVLLFNACGVPHWGQGQLTEEEQYRSDPPLLTGNLLQRHAYTNIELYTHKHTHTYSRAYCAHDAAQGDI